MSEDMVDEFVYSMKKVGPEVEVEVGLEPVDDAKIDHEWRDKVWGRTRCCTWSPYYYYYDLEVKKNTFCSFHLHRRRSNVFFVCSGVIKVVWALGWNLYQKVLSENDDLIVDPNIPHQFQVLEDGLIREEYFSNRGEHISHMDITRFTSGGESDLVQLNRPMIFDKDGNYWKGGVNWISPPSSASMLPESNNSD